MRLKTVTAVSLLLLVLNAGYIWAFASPTIFYMGNVLAHLVIGLMFCVTGLALPGARRRPAPASADPSRSARAGRRSWPGRLPDGQGQRDGAALGAAGAHRGVDPWRPGNRRVRLATTPPRRRRSMAILRRASGGCGVSGGPAGVRSALDTFAPQPARPHREPVGPAADRSPRRRWTLVAILSLVCEDQRRWDHSRQLLHRLGGVRRVPQGCLRAVEELDAPLRVVQQSVLPEIDRVHADRWEARSQASGAPGATITRCSSTAGSRSRSRTRSTPRKRRRAWPAPRVTRSPTSKERWGMAVSRSSIRRSMNWRPARTRTCASSIDSSPI